jgi:hypothetical protein
MMLTPAGQHFHAGFVYSLKFLWHPVLRERAAHIRPRLSVVGGKIG